jgi:hypothetical protein
MEWRTLYNSGTRYALSVCGFDRTLPTDFGIIHCKPASFFSPLLAWEKIKYCQAKHSFYLQEHKYVESLRLNFVGLNILALLFWFFPSPPLPAIIAGFMMSWCLWCTWMQSSLVSMMLLKCKYLAFQCRYIALLSFLSNVYESISTRMTLVTEMAPLGDISH